MENTTPIELLKHDHRAVEEMFQDFQAEFDWNEKSRIIEDVCDNLEIHTKVEEEYFYPEVENISAEGRAMIDDAKHEHGEMKELIEYLRNLNERDETENKFQSLQDTFIHHVREEEGKVFPFAESNIKEKLDTKMAAKMLAVKSKEKVSKWF